MRFLAQSFILYLMFLMGIALFWRPAQDILAFTPVDWAEQYERQHTPLKGSGHASFTQELLRTVDLIRPLTAFIQQNIGDKGTRTQDEQWLAWQQNAFSSDGAANASTAYMALDNPLAEDAPLQKGYVILEDGGYATLAYTRLKPVDQYGKDIPDELHYPYRMIAGAIVFVAAGLLLLGQRTGRKVLKSSSGKGTRFFLFLLCCGLVGVMLPWFYGLTGTHVFGIVYLAGFVLLFGMIGTILFGRETLLLHALLQGKGLLAQWSFDGSEWQAFSHWSREQKKQMTFSGLRLLTIIAVVVSIVFYLFIRDEGAAITVGIIMAVVVFLWLFVSVSMLMDRKKERQDGGEVFIGNKIVYINGLVVSWRNWSSRLESVELTEKPVSMIKLVVSTLMMAGTVLYFFRQHYTYFVPVPQNKFPEARKIASNLRKE